MASLQEILDYRGRKVRGAQKMLKMWHKIGQKSPISDCKNWKFLSHFQITKTKTKTGISKITKTKTKTGEIKITKTKTKTPKSTKTRVFKTKTPNTTPDR